MTKLAEARKITRETAEVERRRPIVVTLGPRNIEVRIKRQRAAYSVSYGALLDLARRLAARDRRGR
jgi:hypothetical protein